MGLPRTGSATGPPESRTRPSRDSTVKRQRGIRRADFRADDTEPCPSHRENAAINTGQTLKAILGEELRVPRIDRRMLCNSNAQLASGPAHRPIFRRPAMPAILAGIGT